MLGRRSVRILVVALAAAGSLTCGESAGPDPNAVASVAITPHAGSIDTGDSLQLSAVAHNAAGDQLNGKSFAWSTLDQTLVTVGSNGRVHGRWPGTARVVAASDGKADTAFVTIIAKITALTITPAVDTLRSLGDVATLTVHAAIDTQAYTGGGSYSWDVSDTAVIGFQSVSFDSTTATIVARRDGAAYVRVREARGVRDSLRIVVRQRVAAILVPQSTVAFRGCPNRIVALAIDARNNAVAGAVLAWATTDSSRATVDASGLVTPLIAGSDTIVISSGDVTRRVALVVNVAATPTLETRGAVAGVTAVGVGQYALAFGDLGSSFPYYLAPARFRVVSSDTTILKSVPADTVSYFVSTTITAGPVRLVGRAVGSVTLTPYLCDVAGPSVPFPVTRATLVIGAPASPARTDDPPVYLGARTRDSTGGFQFIAQPLTVRFTATDTTVIMPDSAYQHLPVGTDQTAMRFTFTDSGTTRVVLLDSSGASLPDSSSPVHVRYPPLFIFSDGAGQADTLHIGMRQKPYYDVYRARVGLDRFVSGQPLVVHVSTSDGAVVAVGPDSAEIPVGQSATTGAFDIASRDSRGTAIVTARAFRHEDDRMAIVVGRPAVRVLGPSPDFALYPGDLGQVQVFAVDSATGSFGFPTEAVTFSLTVSDTSVVSLDSATLTVPGGDQASAVAGMTFKKPGTVTITATDPRVAPYSYAPGTSLPFTVLMPYLVADSVFSLGIGQTFGFFVNVNGRLKPGDVVHLEHRNPAVAMLADTIMTGSGAVGATGIAAGVDTVIATAPGFTPDTGTIVVGPGIIELDYWPPVDLTVGQIWSPPISLGLFAPDGGVRLTADTMSITLTPNANIEFLKDGVPVTSVTVVAGDHSSEQFSLRAKAAGTGTVTFSAPNYTPLTKSVTISP